MDVHLTYPLAAEDIRKKVYGNLPFASHVIRSYKCRYDELMKLFSGVFAKLREASQCVSVYPHRITRTHWTDFHKIWYLSSLRKFVEKISNFVKIGQE